MTAFDQAHQEATYAMGAHVQGAGVLLLAFTAAVLVGLAVRRWDLTLPHLAAWWADRRYDRKRCRRG